ncbi:hypothetical protein [Burkholderia plantarii]|nr:hypothetical protein [Burkholderia plantarii]
MKVKCFRFLLSLKNAYLAPARLMAFGAIAGHRAECDPAFDGIAFGPLA